MSTHLWTVPGEARNACDQKTAILNVPFIYTTHFLGEGWVSGREDVQ